MKNEDKIAEFLAESLRKLDQHGELKFFMKTVGERINALEKDVTALKNK